MVPFPFLRHNYKEKYEFVTVFVRQIGKSIEYKRGYYRVENNILIGRNGRISMEEFMKEMASFWKNSEINLKHRAKENVFDIFLLFRSKFCVQGRFLEEDTVINLSRNRIGFPDLLPRDVKCFLNKENFFRVTPRLLFDNEQCIKNMSLFVFV